MASRDTRIVNPFLRIQGILESIKIMFFSMPIFQIHVVDQDGSASGVHCSATAFEVHNYTLYCGRNMLLRRLY